jgi:hypothetical protein
VIPHSSSQVYPETCTPSFLAGAGPDSGLIHRVIARYFGALEQAFAFGGADDAATRRLKDVQPIYVGNCAACNCATLTPASVTVS